MISIQDNPHIMNHVVVCGLHSSFYYFILPLRAKYLREWQYVVILNQEPPNNEIWEVICRFPKIIYIKGSPLLSEDLQRANINNADKAVIMSQMNFEDTDQMLDAEPIFIFKAIKKCNNDVQIMIELVYPSNIEFLLEDDSSIDNQNLAKGQDEFAYEYTSIYAAGEVYISA